MISSTLYGTPYLVIRDGNDDGDNLSEICTVYILSHLLRASLPLTYVLPPILIAAPKSIMVSHKEIITAASKPAWLVTQNGICFHSMEDTFLSTSENYTRLSKRAFINNVKCLLPEIVDPEPLELSLI